MTESVTFSKGDAIINKCLVKNLVSMNFAAMLSSDKVVTFVCCFTIMVPYWVSSYHDLSTAIYVMHQNQRLFNETNDEMVTV